jgi:hypothetical protein
MNAETRFLFDMLSRIKGATVSPRGFFPGDKTITVRSKAMQNGACVEVCGRTVTIQPSAEMIGTFHGRGWRVALGVAVRRAIRDAEMAS